MKVCGERRDTQSAEVRVRVSGAVSDLHAADGRYHADCKLDFLSHKSIKHAQEKSGAQPLFEDIDVPFESVKDSLIQNKEKIWNSVDLYSLYTSNGGDTFTRRQMIDALQTHFGDEILILSAVGVANLIVFRSSAPKLLRLVSDDDDSDIDAAIKKLSKVIAKEHKSIQINRNQYHTRLDNESIENYVSETLMCLLAAISKDMDHSSVAYMIANMISGASMSYPTPMQVDLGVMIRNSKKLINVMHALGVTCSYDEVLRFKKSAAIAASKSVTAQGLSSNENGLVQVVVDNFDADISSQNGKISTHSLAMLITQTLENDTTEHSNDNVIRRLNKAEMSEKIDFNPEIETYQGPKKPNVLSSEIQEQTLSDDDQHRLNISMQRAKEMDLAFFTDIITNEKCPEYNGYNVKYCREHGHSSKPKTNAVYLPLIDMVPSDPSTIQTALKEAQIESRKCGQDYVVFTGDLQLYRVAAHVIWAFPEQFDNVILRLGGMHTLMSFIGAIGSLMAGSGLYEILESTFGGVNKMMNGKKFPQNARALRIVSEEMLRPLFANQDCQNVEEFDMALEHLRQYSKTSKLWIDCVIKAVFLIMRFIRAERESDWLLHLQCVKEMLPYFFASGHVNYARYGLYYLRSMENMPEECRSRFLKGEHTMRHVPGLWNSIWSDMFIESTFMRYGHGNQGRYIYMCFFHIFKDNVLIKNIIMVNIIIHIVY